MDDTQEMFVTNVGQPPYRYLEDDRENSEEPNKKGLCARTLGKHVPENRLNYVQSIEMTGLNACEDMPETFSTDF